MRRWLNWQDIITFCGVAIVSTVVSIVTMATSPEWAVIGGFILGPVLLLMWAVSGYYLLRHWMTRPDLMTLMGTAVWTNGLAIKGNDVADAINYYAANVAQFHPKLDIAILLSMFGQVGIEFTDDPVWFAKHNSIQRGYTMRVRWGVLVHNYHKKGWAVEYHEGFGYNDFFHACHQMVDEVLLGALPDAPGRLQWWGIVPKLQDGWRSGAKKVRA